jgi:MFS family permease
VLGFVAVTVAFAFAYNGVVAFLPSYLGSLPGVSPEAAGLVYGGFFLVSLVQPASGAAADRWGTLPVSLASLVLAAAGLFGLVAATGLLTATIASLALGVGSHAFRPVRAAHLVALAPGDAAGATLGIARTARMGAGALAPACFGIVAETAGYRPASLGPGGALLLAAPGAGSPA